MASRKTTLKLLWSLVLFLVLTYPSFSLGQGNLEFSEVKWFELSYGPGTCSSNCPQVVLDSLTVIVPIGKVLKIEKLIGGYRNVNTNVPTGTFQKVYLDNASLPIDPDGDGYPIWLPAGSYKLEMVGIENQNFFQVAYISAIEFSITP
mgnify:CR=1 FL=1